MKKIGSILLKGLVTILPIGLTVYFVYWLGITTEALLSRPIKWVIDDANYWPGMGLVLIAYPEAEDYYKKIGMGQMTAFYIDREIRT